MDELLAILGAEAAEYRRLLPLLDEEERILIRADPTALIEVTARRETALGRLRLLEQERSAALGRLAATFGIEAQGLTVSRLIDLAPAHAGHLRRSRDDLRGLLGPLITRHGRNRFLAEHTLACLRGLFATLAAALAPSIEYTRGGRSALTADGLRLLDRHA